MLQLKILYVEDEDTSIKNLELKLRKVKEYISLNSFTYARSFTEAVKLITVDDRKFDVTILDYQLHDKNCWELLSLTKDKIKNYGQVVLTTQHAMEAEKYKSLSQISKEFWYLNKPIPLDELLLFIDKLQHLQSLKHNPESTSFTLNLAKSGERVLNDVNSILMVKGIKTNIGNYCDVIILEDGIIKAIHKVSGNMQHYENTLGLYKNFLRVHRSYIVNVKRIKSHLPDGKVGYLSFTDDPIINANNDYVAMYSKGHENYKLLKELKGFKK